MSQISTGISCACHDGFNGDGRKSCNKVLSDMSKHVKLSSNWLIYDLKLDLYDLYNFQSN